MRLCHRVAEAEMLKCRNASEPSNKAVHVVGGVVLLGPCVLSGWVRVVVVTTINEFANTQLARLREAGLGYTLHCVGVFPADWWYLSHLSARATFERYAHTPQLLPQSMLC